MIWQDPTIGMTPQHTQVVVSFQRVQRVHPRLALCYSRHAGLDRGTIDLDQLEAEVPEATQTDDKQIIDRLSNLAMGPNETTGELLARITNTMVIIKESYAAYDNKVPEPPTDAHGLGQVGLLEAMATQWKMTWSTTCCSFSKCNCSELLYLEI
jgi:hypothetical protein